MTAITGFGDVTGRVPTPLTTTMAVTRGDTRPPVSPSTLGVRPPSTIPNANPTPGMDLQPFGIGSNLRGTQITPGVDPRLAGTQGMVDSAAARLAGSTGSPVSSEAQFARGATLDALRGLRGPDRGAIAADVFSRLRRDTQPAFEEELRGVNRAAAAGGRLGSGVTTTRLGDVASNREQFLSQAAERLASEAASASLGDRLGVLGATSAAGGQFAGEDLARAGFDLGRDRARLSDLAGLEGQQFAEGASNRGEFRTERDFQDRLARFAQGDAVQRALLEDQLLNSAFGRDQSILAMLAGTGYGGGSPSGTLLDAAGIRAGNARSGTDSLSSLLYELARRED